MKHVNQSPRPAGAEFYKKQLQGDGVMPTPIPSRPHSLKSASSQSPLCTEAPQITTSGFLIHIPGASRVPPQHQLSHVVL